MPRSLLALVTLAAACGDDVTAEGSVDGAELTVADSAGTILARTSASTLTIVIADFAPVCSVLGKQAFQAGGSALQMRMDFGTSKPVAGVFDVASSAAQASLFRWDEGCIDRLAAKGVANGGRVIVDSVTASRASGSYELLFPGAGSLKGVFDTPMCFVDLNDESQKNACLR